MAKNKNLTQAKKAKNDEFYTLISDVEKELKHYKKYFEGILNSQLQNNGKRYTR